MSFVYWHFNSVCFSFCQPTFRGAVNVPSTSKRHKISRFGAIINVFLVTGLDVTRPLIKVLLKSALDASFTILSTKFPYTSHASAAACWLLRAVCCLDVNISPATLRRRDRKLQNGLGRSWRSLCRSCRVTNAPCAEDLFVPDRDRDMTVFNVFSWSTCQILIGHLRKWLLKWIPRMRKGSLSISCTTWSGKCLSFKLDPSLFFGPHLDCFVFWKVVMYPIQHCLTSDFFLVFPTLIRWNFSYELSNYLLICFLYFSISQSHVWLEFVVVYRA